MKARSIMSREQSKVIVAIEDEMKREKQTGEDF